MPPDEALKDNNVVDELSTGKSIEAGDGIKTEELYFVSTIISLLWFMECSVMCRC
jgi:hypothetical protein